MTEMPLSQLSRRSLLAGGIVLAGAGAGLLRPRGSSNSAIAAGAIADQAGGGEAVAAFRLSDAIGICTHPNWRKSLWGTSDWQRAFLQTGVRHTRGKIGRGAPARAALGNLNSLFAQGVKICATVASEDGEFDFDETRANIQFLADHVGARNLAGIESANEYNHPKKRPPDWAPRLRDFQSWLYDTVRGNPNLAGVPVIGPSIWGRVTEDYLELGNLQSKLDKACLHYYTGGRRPTRAGRPGGNSEGGGGGGDYGIADAIRDASVIAPGKPMWITEYGYPVAGAGIPSGRGMITETAAAKYLLRGLLDAFAEGVERIYIYSLIDDVDRSPPRYHGLLDGGMRPRPAFAAVRNLMALVADGRAAPASARLDYRLGEVTPAIRHQLFAKSDGTFLLTIYQDVDSYDRRAGRDLDVARVPVRLALAQPASRIELFAPSTSADRVQMVADASGLTIPVGDQVTVVRITPRAGRGG